MLTLLMPPTCAEDHYSEDRCSVESRSHFPGQDGPAIDSPSPARKNTPKKLSLKTPTGAAWLLVEAIDLAEQLGCKVIEAELEGDKQPGLSWHQGRKQLWLDLNDPPAWRLATLADALRGEAGLFYAKMSPELADYLAPRRAA